MSIIHKIVIIEQSTHTNVNVSETVTNIVVKDNTVRKVTVIKIADSSKGADGLSAYELWLLIDGNAGKTEEEFFAEMKGEPGDDGKSAYEIWLDAGNVGDEAAYLASLKGETGDNGLSAYQIWINDGNVGDENDFLLSLKAENTLEEARALDNTIAGNINAAGNTIENLANGIDDQNPSTIAQLNAGVADAKSYTDSVIASGFKLLGDYDLIGNNAYPFGIGSGLGGAIRRNDGWRVWPIGGNFNGVEYQAGDILYSLQAAPGQVDANWSALDWNQQQATEAASGIAKVVQTAEIQNESTVNNKDFVTAIKFWIGIVRFTMMSITFSDKITFSTQSPRLSSLTANRYLKTDNNKDISTVAAIPAGDITTTSLLNFVSLADIANWNSKQAAIGYVPESVSNKSDDGTLATNSSVKYTTEQAVKTYTDTKLLLKQDKATLNVDGLEKAIIKENYFWFKSGTISAVSTGFVRSADIGATDFVLAGNAAGSGYSGFIRFASTAVAGTIAFLRRNDSCILTGVVCKVTRKIKFETNIAGQRFFCGLAKGYMFSAPTNVDPASLVDVVGVCQLSSSTNMQIIHNDASGTATTIDLGVNYPCTDPQYNYFITVEQNAANYIVSVERVTVATGASISTSSTLAANIPNYTTGNIQLLTWISNNATAAIASYVDGGGVGKYNN